MPSLEIACPPARCADRRTLLPCRLQSLSQVLNRNVADDDTVAIKVHQGRRPVAVANTSSVSTARIRGSSMKLEGRDSHKLADNNYGGLLVMATKCQAGTC